jgi:hypothetical protein
VMRSWLSRRGIGQCLRRQAERRGHAGHPS